MEKEKEIKINEKRVIRALTRWSPNGLCGGTLVQANGDPTKTEACAVGCLALEFIHSKPGLKFFKSKKKASNFASTRLYDHATISDAKFNEAMFAYYGLDQITTDQMMGYNDSVVGAKKDADRRFSDVPEEVRKTIYGLRKQFEAFDRKRERDEAKKAAKAAKAEGASGDIDNAVYSFESFDD